MTISPNTYFKEILYDKLPNKQSKKKTKISSDEFKVPDYIDFNNIVDINYNVQQLKTIARFYKQKISGNKNQLNMRLYNFLRYSFYASKLQKKWKDIIRFRYYKLRGPAVLCRKLCNNVTDFLSFDDIKDIPYSQFFSYKDSDGFIYGFDIVSFHNLLKEKEQKNPYNREIITNPVKKKFFKLLKYGSLLKEKLNVKINNDINKLSLKKRIELDGQRIFQSIDTFGHITNADWFLNLNDTMLIKLLRELADIWNYRASLSNQTKINICPPNGNPFYGINILSLVQQNTETLKINLLNIFDKLISSSQNRENQSLGAFYVLSALTLVSQEAATSMPWLYESVYHS